MLERIEKLKNLSGDRFEVEIKIKDGFIFLINVYDRQYGEWLYNEYSYYSKASYIDLLDEAIKEIEEVLKKEELEKRALKAKQYEELEKKEKELKIEIDELYCRLKNTDNDEKKEEIRNKHDKKVSALQKLIIKMEKWEI